MLPLKESKPLGALPVFWEDFFFHFLLPQRKVFRANLIGAPALFLSDLKLYLEIWSTFPHFTHTKPPRWHLNSVWCLAFIIRRREGCSDELDLSPQSVQGGTAEPGLLTFSIDPQESFFKHLSLNYVMLTKPTVPDLLFSGIDTIYWKPLWIKPKYCFLNEFQNKTFSVNFFPLEIISDLQKTCRNTDCASTCIPLI